MRESADWRRSHRSIRRRLRGVVLLPGLALIAMWVLLSSFTLNDGIYTRNVASAVEQVDLPAVQTLSALQKERGLSMLAVRDPSSRPALQQQRQRTDQSLQTLLTAADALRRDSPKVVQERMHVWESELGGLSAGRAHLDAGRLDREAVFGYYNGIIDAGITVFQTQAHDLPDYETGERGLQAAALLQSADRMDRAADLAEDGLGGGDLNPAQHAQVARLIGSYHATLDSAVPDTPNDVRQHYDQLTHGPAYQRLGLLEDQVINAAPWTHNDGTAPPINAQDWSNTATRVSDDLSSLAADQTNYAAEQGLAYSETNLIRVAFGSFVALLVTVIALFSAARVSRSIARRLAALRADALALSGERLPDIVGRLRSGEHVEVGEEITGLDYGTDEIGQLAKAFNTAQRTAVSAAVQESQAREGVNTVFLGIAHRSQALVHRQLRMVDKLEHNTEDPDQMELLFQLDHLATRARRNAENLIILGGGQPGRRWSRPVRLVDVLRSAVAETKHYARVRVHQPPDTALNGGAVADTVHLIAELVDNATSFSPPNSQVTVSAQAVARGVVVEIEDHGLGIEDSELEAANTVLREPPEFDAMALQSDARLGLFVVARLAARHSIGVELRSSPYGGTRAIVLLPVQITATQQEVHELGSDRIPATRIPQSRGSGSVSLSAYGRISAEEPFRESSGPELRALWDRAADSARETDRRRSRPSADSPRGSEQSSGAQSEATWWGGPRPSRVQRSHNGEQQSDGPLPKRLPRDDPPTPGNAAQPETPAQLERPAQHRKPEEPTRSQRPDQPEEPTQPEKPKQPEKPAQAGKAHRPQRPAEPEWPAVDQAPPRSDESSRPPLPRRRRKANLAPELARDQSPGGEPEPRTRSAEQVRGLMSAFQQGTHRGRSTKEPSWGRDVVDHESDRMHDNE